MAANKRRILLSFVLVLLAAFLIYCVLMLRPRFIYQQGVRALKTNDAAAAVVLFEGAVSDFPGIYEHSLITAADRFHLYTDYGQALYDVAMQDWQENGISPICYDRFVQAHESLRKAAAIESQNYFTAFRLASTEHALEILHPWRYPNTPNPYNAQPLYEAASELRPAGISVHQAWARYLHAKGRTRDIPDLVRHLLAISPPFYNSLKKEPYFTPELLTDAAQGLKTAVQKGIRPRDALRYLSQLSRDQDNPAGAIDFFEAYLAHDPKDNSASDFIHLGALYLTDGRYGDSHDMFVRSLAESDNPDAVLSRIYRIFKNRKQGVRFLTFADALENAPIKVAGLDLVRAQCYLDLDQMFLAKKILERIISDNPTGPACYLRAQIAAKEKDWEAMETYSQQATRIDPYNAGYHYYLARALYTRKKYEDAEFALNRAIRHAGREQAGYFHLRAWTRWHQKKFLAAAEDWDRAAALNPDHQEYRDRAAQAREKSRTDPDSEYNQTRF
jgi:tetratricopeptide (TPR) repeat protein